MILPRQELPCLLHLPLQSPPLRLFLLSFGVRVLLAFASRSSRIEVLSLPPRTFSFPFTHTLMERVLSTSMNMSICLLVGHFTNPVTYHSAMQLRCVSSKSTVSTRQPAESARKAPLANHKKAPQPTSKIGGNVLKSSRETAITPSESQ
jgi:hypothetical protein